MIIKIEVREKCEHSIYYRLKDKHVLNVDQSETLNNFLSIIRKYLLQFSILVFSLDNIEHYAVIGRPFKIILSTHEK